MNPYSAWATVVLVVHLTWIVWVIFGWLVARRRSPAVRWFHFGSLIYGIFIEIAPWACPLTCSNSGSNPRRASRRTGEPFLVHYLEAVVYPNVPARVLITAAVLVCGFNLYLHLRRITLH